MIDRRSEGASGQRSQPSSVVVLTHAANNSPAPLTAPPASSDSTRTVMGKAGRNPLRLRVARALAADVIRRPRSIDGRSRRLEVFDLAPRIKSLSVAQAVAVLSADLWERWLAGERVPAETYLDLRPDLRSDEKAVDLVYGEFLVREQIGEAASPEEYVARFPGFEPQLRRQFELHQALASGDNDDLVNGTAWPDAASGPPKDGSNCSPQHNQATLSVAGYEVLGELGRGGMGVVYKARASSSRPPGRAQGDPGGRTRRSRTSGPVPERGGVAGADPAPQHHPDLRSGRAGRTSLLCHGVRRRSDSGERFSGIPLQARHAAHMVETLARAIHAANERGVIHRDLKPANVLMTSGGVLKITDFGLAKRLDNRTNPTGSGELMGTPSYMAPSRREGVRH